jgi:choline dehydrogenase
VGPQGYDVVIVGGGSAGCVVARRLAERGDRSVLLLEAGPDLRGDISPALRDGWNNPMGGEWVHDWGYATEPAADGSTQKLRRGRLLGGTSWLTRFAVRGAAADFDAWAARGNPGWSYAEVLPSFRRLEADAEFGDRPWHGDAGPITIQRYPNLQRAPIHEAVVEALRDHGFPAIEDHNAPDAIGVGPMPMSTRDGRRLTTLDAYLPEPRPTTLEIRVDAPVATVAIAGGRAHGVRLMDGTEIAARRVILAAGVYGSPPILLRSGVGPAGDLRALGIDVAADLPGVGANLADHPGVDLDSGWRGDGATAPILHSIATFRSSGQPASAAPDLMFWNVDPAGSEATFSLDPILLKPESRGWVRLRSADPADPPRIQLPSVQAAWDVERLAEGYRLGLALANHPAIRERRRVLEGAYSNPHVVGTCRMGPTPGDGDVVDAAGSVHGVAALSVIDASVIPDAPAGFPHVITIMLAEHLSRRLAAMLGTS